MREKTKGNRCEDETQTGVMWPQAREAKECQQPEETITIVKHTRRILIELSVIVIAIRLLGESPKYTNSFYMEIWRGKKKKQFWSFDFCIPFTPFEFF